MKKFIFLLMFAALIACCCEQQPQARSESSGLTCSLNANLKTQLDTYFQSNPLPEKVIKGRESWARAIILKKNKIYTNHMDVHLMLYMRTGEIKFWKNLWGNAAQLDLATSIGADILFSPPLEWGIRTDDLIIIRENAICIPDTITVLGEN